MSQSEWDSWVEFFRLYPFDDYHRYHRPAALTASSMSGEYDKKINFLQPIPIDTPDAGDERYSSVDREALAAFLPRKK